MSIPHMCEHGIVCGCSQCKYDLLRKIEMIQNSLNKYKKLGGIKLIKTIKVKKQLRLDELIKYVWDNRITNTEIYIDAEDEGENRRYLSISQQGMIRFMFGFYPDETFTVEEEEEISRETVFEHLVILQEEYDDLKVHKAINSSINDVYSDSETWKIYALIDNDLELIWDKEGESE